MDKNAETILQRKQRTVKVTDEEIICMLRAYMANPSKWTDIIRDMRSNLNLLNNATQQLYLANSTKQLRDRLSCKLSAFMAKTPENISNIQIRNLVEQVRALETRHVDGGGDARQAKGDLDQIRPVKRPVNTPVHDVPPAQGQHLVQGQTPAQGQLQVQCQPRVKSQLPVQDQPSTQGQHPAQGQHPIKGQLPVQSHPPVPGPSRVQGPRPEQSQRPVSGPRPLLGPRQFQGARPVLRERPVPDPRPMHGPRPEVRGIAARRNLREIATAALSSSTSDEEAPLPQPRRRRKRPLMDLVRENQETYKRFMTKKIPKILRELGISSTDDSD